MYFSFLDDIGDFLWRPNSDNLVSVGSDKRLYHVHISSAVKTEKLISLFSLNFTSTGHVHVVMPNINNEYVCALYSERHISVSPISLKKCYSEHTMSKFLNWNQTIAGESIVGIYSSLMSDNSVLSFHKFAQQWTFGDGDRSSETLTSICDINSFIAEQSDRPDLKATWQVIKMIYGNYDGLHHSRVHSSRNTPSATQNHHVSDSLSGHRQHKHHHYQQTAGKSKLNGIQQQQESEFNEELNGRKTIKSTEQIIPPNSQMGKIKQKDLFFRF